MSADDQLLAEVRALSAKVDQFVALVAPLALRQRTRERQAKKAGVSRTTLWRREQRAKASLALMQRSAPLRRTS